MMPDKRPNTFAIPVDMLDATVNYLATRPYREVFQLINALSSLKPVPEVLKKEDKPNG